jgi:erythritol kinase (D-erythritol 1-phosphate-forming)
MTALAVDAGTSVIKAVVFDDNGQEIALARESTEVLRPARGWAEQDMTAVWDAVATAVRNALAQAPSPVQFVAVTAQGDGCWLVDADGNPTGPAILWSDARAAAIVSGWRRDGVLDDAFRRNGSLTFAGLPNAIITWLARHDPERLRRSDAALYCGGWLHLRLTGRRAVDESDAAAPLLDIRSREYAPELLRLFDLEPHSRLLPPVRDDRDRVAPLAADAATELGLPAGLPVVLAPYDVVSTAIGASATTPGQACAILGTTLCTAVVRGKPDTRGPAAGLTLPLPASRILRAFPTLAGAEVLHWVARLLAIGGAEELAELAAAAEPGADGLLFLPYLSPAGERAPFLDSQARGTLFGVTLQHDRAAVARAAFEGLTLVIAECLAAAGSDVTALHCSGGGASSQMWCQLIADVVGVPVHLSTDREVGAKGAYLVGLVATGAASNLDDAVARYVRMRRTFTPEADRTAQYRHLFERFRAHRQVAAQAWHLNGVKDEPDD